MSFRFSVPEYFTLAATRRALVLAFPVDNVPAAAGYADVHLTASLEGKRWRPHVTFRGPGTRQERVDLANMPFDEFVATMVAMGNAAALAWWRMQQPITAEQVADEHWKLLEVSPAAIERIGVDHFSVRGQSVKLTSSPEDLVEDLALFVLDEKNHRDPRDLDRQPSGRPVFALRPVDGGFDGWILAYVRQHPLTDSGPGWYAMPLVPDTVRMMLQIMLEKYGSVLVDMLAAAEAALGFGVTAHELVIK